MKYNASIRHARPVFTTKILLLVDPYLKDKITQIADMNNMTANAFIRESVQRNLNQYEKVINK